MTMRHSITGSGGAVDPAGNNAATPNGGLWLEESVAAAQAGSLTTRTDDDSGEITMTSGAHTITTGSKICIAWTGGSRYNVTVGTVSGTAVPFGAGGGEGSGDNLPAGSTAVVVTVQEEHDFAFTGNDLRSIIIGASNTSRRCSIDFHGPTGTSHWRVELDAQGVANWMDPDVGDLGFANPVAGDDITCVQLACLDSAGTTTIKIDAGLTA